MATTLDLSHDAAALQDYKVVRRISEGRFGTVFEATKLSTDQHVAIKKIHARRPPPGYAEDPWTKSAQREIEVLSRVQHGNVVSMLEHMVPPCGSITILVYEYLAWDLGVVLKRLVPLSEGQVRALLRMLFTGLAHLHESRVMHRDLKPANLLLDGDSGVLKIADFGSARFVPELQHELGLERDKLETDDQAGSELGGLLTRDVCTRWYKSPEMLFGSVDYTIGVDLWAAGCVAGDLLSPQGDALFPGNSDLEQLCIIFQMRGTLREEDWPEVVHLPDYNKVEFKPREPVPLPFEPHRSVASAQLVLGLLQLPPDRRTPASAVLSHAFFREEESTVEELQQLLETLGPPASEHPDTPSDFSPLHECAYGSEDSCLDCPAGEFEPVEIETTTCGLWDDSGLRMDRPVGEVPGPAAAGPRTPPPPTDGVHRFKVRAVGDSGRGPGTPPPPSDGEHRFKSSMSRS